MHQMAHGPACRKGDDSEPTLFPGRAKSPSGARYRLSLKLVLLPLLVVVGCHSAEVKECRDRYLQTHASVAGVDTGDLLAVERTLAEVEANLVVCQQANLAEESKQLTTAKRKLESHQSYLRQRESHKPLTPEQIESLVHNGDPECPRGQAYLYKQSGKKIRCVGPQIVSMTLDEARAYFTGRGYTLHDKPNGVKAELGSESYHFEYAPGATDEPARCLSVFSVPGIAWQETASRVSGVKPSRLKEGTPMRVGQRDLPFVVEKDPVQAILHFGECDGKGIAKPSDAPVSSQDDAE